jgi:tRNA 2-selenouridine synthase SelU
LKEYSLILSELVSSNTKIKVFELQKNEVSLFGSFFEKVKSNSQRLSSTTSALKYIEQSANLFHLPNTRHRDLKGLDVPVKVYEAKKDDIRIYCFQDTKGRVIVLGGYKGKQNKDINKVVNIIKEYLKEYSYDK